MIDDSESRTFGCSVLSIGYKATAENQMIVHI